MYTYIPTHISLPLIKQYSIKHGHEFSLTMQVTLALCDALVIVMPLNLIRFSDCYFKQISGGATTHILPRINASERHSRRTSMFLMACAGILLALRVYGLHGHQHDCGK